MTKKSQQRLEKDSKTPEELEIEKRINEAVTRINAALSETRTILQPYMDASPLAIIPRIRVIPAAEETKPEQDLAAEVKSHAKDQ